jgi:UDP-N-acetylmuramyl pentapeptide synthase
MNVQITLTSREKDFFYFQATCGKKSAFVSICPRWITVCCQNAAHQVWRKCGRTFETIAEAVAAYKSPEMRAIIQAAQTAADDATTASQILTHNAATIAATN